MIPSQTTQAQPSAGDLAKLATHHRREDVKAIFPESSINPKLAKAIARETGASGRPHALRRHARPRRLERRDVPRRWRRANADAMVRGLHRRRAGLPRWRRAEAVRERLQRAVV